jgi:NADP-dependent 3-hydroxy acid dehydrogenase YdfG
LRVTKFLPSVLRQYFDIGCHAIDTSHPSKLTSTPSDLPPQRHRTLPGAGSAAIAAVALSGLAEAQAKQPDSAWSGILKGKAAVASGAARGIGRAAAVALAQSGASVAETDICAIVDPRSGGTRATKAELDETGQLVQQAGGNWQSFVLDQHDLPSLRSAAAQIEYDVGGIDILFANTSIQSFWSILDMECRLAYHDRRQSHRNGKCHSCLRPAMVRRGSGRINVTTSTQGRHGTLYASAYSASKWESSVS